MELTSQQIKEKISNGENFILDCYAVWCGPCKVMLPHLESATKIISESFSSVGVHKYNIDSDREFTFSLGIRSVPTIKVYKSGQEVVSRPGMLLTEQIVDLARTNFS